MTQRLDEAQEWYRCSQDLAEEGEEDCSQREEPHVETCGWSSVE